MYLGKWEFICINNFFCFIFYFGLVVVMILIFRYYIYFYFNLLVLRVVCIEGGMWFIVFD